MDGFKGKIISSVRFKLSIALIGGIAAVAIVAAYCSFQSAYDEAYEFQDETLQQIGALLVKSSLMIGKTTILNGIDEDDSSMKVIVQIIDNKSPVDIRHTTSNLKDGFYSLNWNGEFQRVYIKTMQDGTRVAISQATWLRDEAARESAIYTIAPFLLLLAILMIANGFLISKAFKPIDRIAGSLDAIEGVASSIPIANMPNEIVPFIKSINLLISKNSEIIIQQKRFIADAAHELRSPLAALVLQIDRLSTMDLNHVAKDQVNYVKAGIERERLLLDKLLDLAKAQSSSFGEKEEVSLFSIFRDVLCDLMPLADKKKIDIGILSGEDVMVYGCYDDLMQIFRNLIENSINHTPRLGKVDIEVSKTNKKTIIKISDNGPGIPIEERDRVFDPFYRVNHSKISTSVPGSGLGLSIVKNLATRQNANIDLEWTDKVQQIGLTVIISIFDSYKKTDATYD